MHYANKSYTFNKRREDLEWKKMKQPEREKNGAINHAAIQYWTKKLNEVKKQEIWHA